MNRKMSLSNALTKKNIDFLYSNYNFLCEGNNSEFIHCNKVLNFKAKYLLNC